MAESLRSVGKTCLRAQIAVTPQHPMARGQQEREQKLGGLDQNDATGGITVCPKTDEQAQHTRQHTTGDGQKRHPVKTIRQQIGRGTRGHQHGDHQNDSNGLQAGHSRQRQQTEQGVVQLAGVDPNRSRMGGIKTEQHQIPPPQQQHDQHEQADPQGLPKIIQRNSEHMSKQDVVEMNVADCF